MDSSGGDQAAQAAQIWSMLDDMADNDPAAYRKFVEKHIKEGQEANAPPVPNMCVQTCIKATASPVYLNLCGWPRVPKPKDENAPIPCHGPKLIEMEATEEDHFHHLAYIAFNPEVVELYGQSCTNRPEQDALIQLAMQFTEDQNKVKLSGHYTIMKENHKGDKSKLASAFGMKKDAMKGDIENLAKTFAPVGSVLTKDPSLIDEMTVSGDVKSKPSQSMKLTPDIRMPGVDNKPVKPCKLIEEIKVKPNFVISTREADSSCGRKIIVKIDLDDINSVEQCILDVTESTLKLEALAYNLHLRLPELVCEEEVKAKFSKNKHQLTVTLPIRKECLR